MYIESCTAGRLVGALAIGLPQHPDEHRRERPVLSQSISGSAKVPAVDGTPLESETSGVRPCG